MACDHSGDSGQFNESDHMNNHTRDEWLAQIRQNPSDWQTMLIFADWLEESGDLLAAEQWRWMSVTHGCSHQIDSKSMYADSWPTGTPLPRTVLPAEKRWAKRHKIRCMLTYPTTLADVEEYLQASR